MSYASPKTYNCKNRASPPLKKKIFSSPSTNEQNAKYRKLAILVERSSVGRSVLGPTPAEFTARRAALKRPPSSGRWAGTGLISKDMDNQKTN